MDRYTALMEAELIQWLRDNVPRFGKADISIGDDAAVLPAPNSRLAVTVDTLMDGIHFRSGELALEQIGRKALGVNISDLAAMAAEPSAAVVSLTIPNSMHLDDVKRLFDGMFELSRRFEIEIVGGDTNSWDGPLTISITAFGMERGGGFWTRSGARVGDTLMVTGGLGGSILKQHYEFVPRIDEAMHMLKEYEIHAATDITDGLARDLTHILEASRCGAVLEQSAIPISAAARELARSTGRSPLDHALNDGEDFELLIATSGSHAERMLEDPKLDIVAIGRCTDSEQLLQRDDNGDETVLAPGGYQH
ncbi:MAG: thiamine-monophosphate kinase [Pirellulaceae bacterium]